MKYSFLACIKILGEFSIEKKNLRFMKKLIIETDSINELKDVLRRIDYKNNLITVHPLSITVARWCVHDSRIDTILMTIKNIEIFDKKQLKMMRNYGKPVEVSMKDLLTDDSKLRGMLYRRLNLLVKYDVALTIGTGANDSYEIFHPLTIIMILNTMYDMPIKRAMLALTDNPRQLLYRKQGGNLGSI